MDVPAIISQLPTLYQRPVPLLRERMPYVPSVFPKDIVDRVEIRKGGLSSANTAIMLYSSFARPIIEKGLLIDLFV